MLVYLISFITGAVVGYIGSKLFPGQGWGVIANTIVGAVGGYIGNAYLAPFFHSFENVYLENAVPAAIGGTMLLLVVMFAFNHDTGGD
ncbi:hypothetical protein ACQ33O_07720 [Ferruginibacter sp. SUN002]|uniref:hypothetical protein n=1 Tax=Ferruginibacter sp. SUN002 TaxID=2937789 RepID=UPI003D369A03